MALLAGAASCADTGDDSDSVSDRTPRGSDGSAPDGDSTDDGGTRGGNGGDGAVRDGRAPDGGVDDGGGDGGTVTDGGADDGGPTDGSADRSDGGGLTGPWASVSVGHNHACAVARDGTMACWGNNTYGELGDGASVCPTPPLVGSHTPVLVPGVTSAIAVTAGYSHTCALIAGGTVKCWGANDSDQLGVAATDPSCLARSTPADVPGITGVTAIAAGSSHTCALHDDGGVSCWGSNTQGQLGRGSVTPKALPARVSGLADKATSISVSDTTSCARLASGALQCWGSGPPGLFGQPAITSTATPTTLQGFGASTALVAGPFDVCVVTPTGTLRCLGDDLEDQLGAVDAGPLHHITTPIDIPGVSDLADIAVGDSFICGRSSVDGSVACWGRTPSRDGSTTPLVVTGLESGIRQVSVSPISRFGCALTDGGAVLCWGNDDDGVLGDGSSSYRPNALPIASAAPPAPPPPPPDAGGDAGPACPVPATIPAPSCAPPDYGPTSVVAATYKTGPHTLLTISNTYAMGGGFGAYALRFNCTNAQDIWCSNQGTFSQTIQPGEGTVYLVGTNSFMPTVTLSEPPPPASNSTCATALPIMANQGFTEPNPIDDQPRYYKVTVPHDSANGYAWAYVDIGGVNIQLLATCSGPVLASAVSPAMQPIIATTDVVPLFAGDYILVANASQGSKLSVNVIAN